MLTTSIQSAVQDNLNRSDSGITSKINNWINEAKRRVERRFNMEYMKANYTYAFVAPAQSVALTTIFSSDVHRFKDIFYAAWRQTAGSNTDLTWTEIPRMSEAEVLDVESYTSASQIYTGPPEGWTLDELNFYIHPQPDSGNTYTANLWVYLFSADWTISGNEEPYLAKFAYDAVIAGSTMLGFDYMGEVQDAQKWQARFEEKMRDFHVNESARVLGSVNDLVPLTGSQDRGVHRRKGTQWWMTGWGRI